MDAQRQEPGRGVRSPGAGTGGDHARSLRRPAAVVGLAAAALCLVAACSSPSTTPGASGPSATPTQSVAQPTTPAASSQPTSPPATGSSSTVTAAPASSAQVAAFTTAAAGNCGFTSSADTLTNAKVTNNGWASATVTARNPADQGNASMVFKQGASWSYVTCGSDFSGGTIPQDVLAALGL